jgi:hypothetical protein
MAGMVKFMSTEAEKAKELQEAVKKFTGVMAKLVDLVQRSGPELQGKSVADIVSVKPGDKRPADSGLHQ